MRPTGAGRGRPGAAGQPLSAGRPGPARPAGGRRALLVGGVTPLSSLDYPGELAAVVFCQGCPWRCRYCHNGHLLAGKPEADIAWPKLLAWLQRRRGLLDAVVFSGGEPTLQPGLADAVREVRALGFKIGLHTAGCYPQHLQGLLPLLDWVGLDIKALPEDYAALTGVPGSGARALQSLRHVMGAGVSHEVRVTVHQDLLPMRKLQQLFALLEGEGVDEIMLQRCRTTQMLDAQLGGNVSRWLPPERCSAHEWSSRAWGEGQA